MLWSDSTVDDELNSTYGVSRVLQGRAGNVVTHLENQTDERVDLRSRAAGRHEEGKEGRIE
jgi:hypothetical protein